MTAPNTLAILQSALVDLIDLTLLSKQVHWNVHGVNFRSVHLQLDEVEEQLRGWQDEIAERSAAVGGHPDGRAATVASASKVEAVQAGPVEAHQAVTLFSDRLDGAARRIEAALPELDQDMPSQDILIATVQGLDKAAWMFRAQLS